MIILLVLGALLLVSAGLAFARGGGGEMFGGGGGGSGSDSLDILFLVIWLLDLCIEYPIVGIPLTIIVVIVLILGAIFGKRKGTDVVQTATIRKANRMVEEADRRNSERFLSALKQRDPAFTEEKFLSRTRAVFLTVQEAWSRQDLGAARHYVSAGVRERFEVQFDLQRAQGFRNRLDEVAVLDAQIAAAYSDRHFDTVHVKVTGQAKDDYVDLTTGAVIRHNTDDPFTEFWTFMRRPGAKTLEKGGLVEGNCPNCGAPLRLSDAGQCDHCKAVVTSGDYDWVLTAITQESAWAAASDPSRIPGYDAMSAKDPAFCVPAIVDRATVVFWRLVKAYFMGDPAAVTSAAHPNFLGDLAGRLAPDADGRSRIYHEAAVGGVDVSSITVRGQDGLDRVELVVTWSARDAVRGPDGAVTGAGERTVRYQYYTLVRRTDATTYERASFRAAPCHSCGAPDEGARTGACPYCNAPTNDGSRDWVLLGIGSFTAAAAAASAVTRSRQPEVAVAPLLSAMAAAMFADGVVDEREGALLQEVARNNGVSVDRLGQILAAVRAGAPLPAPADKEEARAILFAMARTVLADGKITVEERNLLDSYAASQGYTRAEVNHALNRTKGEIYRESRDTIREIRKGGPA